MRSAPEAHRTPLSGPIDTKAVAILGTPLLRGKGLSGSVLRARGEAGLDDLAPQ